MKRLDSYPTASAWPHCHRHQNIFQIQEEGQTHGKKYSHSINPVERIRGGSQKTKLLFKQQQQKPKEESSDEYDTYRFTIDDLENDDEDEYFEYEEEEEDDEYGSCQTFEDHQSIRKNDGRYSGQKVPYKTEGKQSFNLAKCIRSNLSEHLPTTSIQRRRLSPSLTVKSVIPSIIPSLLTSIKKISTSGFLTHTLTPNRYKMIKSVPSKVKVTFPYVENVNINNMSIVTITAISTAMILRMIALWAKRYLFDMDRRKEKKSTLQSNRRWKSLFLLLDNESKNIQVDEDAEHAAYSENYLPADSEYTATNFTIKAEDDMKGSVLNLYDARSTSSDGSSIISSQCSTSRKGRHAISPMHFLRRTIPSSISSMLQNMWMWIGNSGNKIRSLASLQRNSGSSGKSSKAIALEVDYQIRASTPLTLKFLNTDFSHSTLPSINFNEELNTRNEFNLSKDASAEAKSLRLQLDSLTKSHESLEQEYEASLRLLHDARLEVRRFKGTKSSSIVIADEFDEDSQRKQMEIIARKLDGKYKQQMKDQIEHMRHELETTIRDQMRREYDAQLEEEVKRNIQEGEEKVMTEPLLRRKVEELVAREIDDAIAEAVQRTKQYEQQKAREEMMRVRDGIQKILERERRLMKEQVRKASEKFRDWVERQQSEQLQGKGEEVLVDQEDHTEKKKVSVREDLNRRRRTQSRQQGFFQDTSDRYTLNEPLDAVQRLFDDEEYSGGLIPINKFTERIDKKFEDVNDIESGEGDIVSMQQQLRRQRLTSQRSSLESKPRNVYREAAKRKQQIRDEQKP